MKDTAETLGIVGMCLLIGGVLSPNLGLWLAGTACLIIAWAMAKQHKNEK